MTGAEFERETERILTGAGFWVHRLAPSENGSQPFDIIAIKNGLVCAIDCKVVSSGKRFRMSRVEDNQLLAMERFLKKTGDNGQAVFLVYFVEQDSIRFLDFMMEKEALFTPNASLHMDDLPEWGWKRGRNSR